MTNTEVGVTTSGPNLEKRGTLLRHITKNGEKDLALVARPTDQSNGLLLKYAYDIYTYVGLVQSANGEVGDYWLEEKNVDLGGSGFYPDARAAALKGRKNLVAKERRLKRKTLLRENINEIKLWLKK